MKMENLIRLRKARRMSQELVSGLIGVSCRAYSNWEAGLSEMRASDLKKISEVLGVSMEDILDGSSRSESIIPSVTLPAGVTPLHQIAAPPLPDRAPGKIEIEVELSGKSKVRFSVPSDTSDERIGKLINQVTEQAEK